MEEERMVNKNKREALPDRQDLEAPPTLEQRIVDALRGNDIASTELEKLIAETEQAISTASKNATALREQASDLQRCTDAKAAFEASELAGLGLDRLETVLPRLRDHLSRAIAKEQHAEWQHEYDELLSRHDPLAEQLNELDARQDAIDAERRKLNHRADAYNELAGAINRRADELREGRQLPIMALSVPPGVVNDAGKKWGPPKIAGAGLAVGLARSMAAVPATAGGIGPDWFKPEYRQAQRDAIAKQQAELAAQYARMDEAQLARENEEERRRWQQQHQQRGAK